LKILSCQPVIFIYQNRLYTHIKANKYSVINVEALKINDSRRMFLTVSDLLNGARSNNYHLGPIPATKLLADSVNQQLKNISVGSKFGRCGIDINLLLAEQQNIVVEASYAHLACLPVVKQRQLLKNYTVIVTDLEEGGDLRAGKNRHHLVDHVASLNIIPKQIIHLTGGYGHLGYPALNITHVFLDLWPFQTVLNNKVHCDIIFNPGLKQEYLDQLCKHNPAKKFGLVANRKARPWRIKLLSEMHRRGQLKNFDWSLIFSPESQPVKILPSSPRDESLKEFLSAHSWPKVITDTRNESIIDIIKLSDTWFNKYGCYISNETYCHKPLANRGYFGFITEKTYKATAVGAYPFIMSHRGTETELCNRGFKLLDFGYDHLEGWHRINAICNAVEKFSADDPAIQNCVLHNWQLIHNKDWLAERISAPLNQIAAVVSNQAQ